MIKMKILYRKKETKNLGNYENVSIEIGIEDEVNFEIETSEDCFFRLKNFINAKLTEQFSTVSITAEQMQIEAANLIEESPKNRTIIKGLLNNLGVSKIKELNSVQLSQLNEQLKLLRGKNEK